MRAIDEFARIIAETPYIETERAKKCLVHLFERATVLDQDVKFVFPEDQSILGDEVAGGLGRMIQMLGFSGFIGLMESRGIQAFFATDLVPNDEGGYEVAILPGKTPTVDEGRVRSDIATEIEFDEDTVATINAIRLPEVA